MGFLPDIRKIVKHLPRGAAEPSILGHYVRTISRALPTRSFAIPWRVQIGQAAPVAQRCGTPFIQWHRSKDALRGPSWTPRHQRGCWSSTRTKRRSKNLARLLEDSGYEAAAPARKPQPEHRRKAMEGFGSGRYKILVGHRRGRPRDRCPRISHVINYDIPATVDAYTHRIAARAALAIHGDASRLVCQERTGALSVASPTAGKPDKYRVMERIRTEPDRLRGRWRRPATESESGAASHPVPRRQGPPRELGR